MIPLSQDVVIQLQREIGNQAVKKLIGRTKSGPQGSTVIQREVLETPLTGLGASLVGLKRGDGLDFGKWDKRERVELLQTKLNEKMVAFIKVDGKFGPRTEEVLREFQESIEQLPSGVVDPITADLLMSEANPEPATGSAGETPHPSFVVSGAELSKGAKAISEAAGFISSASSSLSQSVITSVPKKDIGHRVSAASFLLSASEALSRASGELLGAAITLSMGEEQFVNQAGEKLVSASQEIFTAGGSLTGAGISLQRGLDFSDKLAGIKMLEFADKLVSSGSDAMKAGEELKLYRDQRQLIGDPIVGLRRGDGLNWGTWNRRARVRILQEELNTKHGAGLKVDGMFGPLTTSAVQTAQTNAGLPMTKRVDLVTARAIRQTTPLTRKTASLKLAGQSLNKAGTTIIDAVPSLYVSGSTFSSGQGSDMQTGMSLIMASNEFAAVGEFFVTAGTELQKI
jgi:peptidoglycan hydrolase-like protein with peptidoglycan-binding domain